MSETLPNPLVPPEVDLRGAPLPLALFVEMAMRQFGLDRETAERTVRSAAAAVGEPVEQVGRG
jgi:hypothetical protein